jgi:hypothetical protein
MKPGKNLESRSGTFPVAEKSTKNIEQGKPNPKATELRTQKAILSDRDGWREERRSVIMPQRSLFISIASPTCHPRWIELECQVQIPQPTSLFHVPIPHAETEGLAPDPQGGARCYLPLMHDRVTEGGRCLVSRVGQR